MIREEEVFRERVKMSQPVDLSFLYFSPPFCGILREHLDFSWSTSSIFPGARGFWYVLKVINLPFGIYCGVLVSDEVTLALRCVRCHPQLGAICLIS